MTNRNSFGDLLDSCLKQHIALNATRGIAALEGVMESLYEAFNLSVEELLRRYATRLHLQLDPEKGSWESAHAILVIRYGKSTIRIKVHKMDLYLIREIKKMNKLQLVEDIYARLVDEADKSLESIEFIEAIQTPQPSRHWVKKRWAGFEIDGAFVPLMRWVHDSYWVEDTTFIFSKSPWIESERNFSLTGEKIGYSRSMQITSLVNHLLFKHGEIQREEMASDVKARWERGDYQVGDTGFSYIAGGGFFEGTHDLCDTKTNIKIMEIDGDEVVVRWSQAHNTDSIEHYHTTGPNTKVFTRSQLAQFQGCTDNRKRREIRLSRHSS